MGASTHTLWSTLTKVKGMCVKFLPWYLRRPSISSQRYMDFAFVSAMNHIPALLLILLLYDIMCQYWVHFLTRISGYLDLKAPFEIKRGIGLFHVHGHIKECYPRYAPTFIPGAGMIDGEVIETLWNTLNHTASSARAMSWYHRQEYLDAHMADSNRKKLQRMGSFSASIECCVSD